MEIAICDDNKAILDVIEKQLLDLDMVDNIYTYSNLDTFLFSIDNGRRYDAVLMDIEWGEKSTGIDVAAELYKLCPETKIIYVTGHIELSQYVFLNRSNLNGFLSKPVDTELLRANLQKVLDTIALEEQPCLVFKQKGTPFLLPFVRYILLKAEGTLCLYIPQMKR